jgi:hypothetical protein
MTRWKQSDLPPSVRARIVESAHQPISSKGPAAHKYGAKEVWVDNIRFSSKLEAEHYKILKLLKASGEIRYFLRQVKFHLPGTTHLVDWMVVTDGPPAFLDSKGYDLPMGRLKRKQVLELYGVQIHVWTSPAELPQCLKREKVTE